MPGLWVAALLVMAVPLHAAAVACDFAAQNRALVAFWSATGGEQWNWRWDVGGAHCAWRGVVCEDACVVGLALYSTLGVDAGLRGTLPDVWSDLSTLRELDLGASDTTNVVSGPLPPSFAALEALELLFLGGLDMSGPIGVLGAMPVLQDAYLYGNNFGGALPELTQPSLRVLRLEGNLLTGPLPGGYGSLPLTRLNLDDNLLTSTVPPELGALPMSTEIHLRGNADLRGVLPHTLLGRGGNLRLGGTQVTVGCAAGWRYNASAFACSPCDAGFSTLPGSYTPACAACGPGSEAPSAGSACAPCAAGTFSNETANSECSPCPDGLFSPPSAQACGECPAGSGPSAVPGVCDVCSAGTASPGGSSECAVCPAGTASAAGASQCSSCGGGLYSPTPKSPQCLECSAGSFSNGTANTSCRPCPRGLVALLSSSTRCEPCGAGRIGINDGRACIGCDPGSSTGGATVATSCLPCDPGTVASGPGTPSCEPCPAGSTSNAAKTSCDPCPAGWSTEGADGALACAPCPAGTAAEAGAAACETCEPGTFASSPGRDACEACPIGSSTGGAAGAQACVTCAAGSVAGAGNATCSLCAPGSFAATDGLAACTVCPAGTHQPEAGATTTCPACRYPGRCLEGNACAEGYAGAGCLFCEVGHFRLSNVCVTCPVVPWPLIVLAVLAVALLYVASKNRLGARQTTVLKIVLFYVQMVVVALAIQVEWPKTQTGFVEAMSFASAEIGLPLADCYVSVGWYTGYAWSLAGPLAVVVVFWTATRYAEWRRRRQWQATSNADLDFALMGQASHMRRLWISAFAAMHLPLVRVLLTVFDCERDADGTLVVAGSDDGTRCTGDTHAAVQAVSGVLLALIALVLPTLAVVFVLWLRRTGRLDKGSVQASWGALYEGYRPEYCYLEGVVAMRKVFVTVTLVVPGIAVGWRSALLLVQSAGWGVFVLVRRPYVRVRGRVLFGLVRRQDVINELEVVVSVVVSLHQAMAGLAAVINSAVVWAEAGVVLLVITLVVLLAALWQTVRIDRGFEVTPTGFSQPKAQREQRQLHGQYLGAIARNDFDEAGWLRADGVRHARQTREFAEWRTDTRKVSKSGVPFLEMAKAEETTDRAELEAAIEAATTGPELVGAMEKAIPAGHFDLVVRALNRKEALETGEPGSSGGGESSPGMVRAVTLPALPLRSPGTPLRW